MTQPVAELRSGDQALTLDGVAVTATAAEINAIAGNGLSAAELAVLDGVTAGSGTFRARRSAANAYVVYRIA